MSAWKVQHAKWMLHFHMMGFESDRTPYYYWTAKLIQKQKWALSFSQFQLLPFKSSKLITVLHSNIIYCLQRDLQLTFLLLSIFTDEKAKTNPTLLCEKVKQKKDLLQQLFFIYNLIYFLFHVVRDAYILIDVFVCLMKVKQKFSFFSKVNCRSPVRCSGGSGSGIQQLNSDFTCAYFACWVVFTVGGSLDWFGCGCCCLFFFFADTTSFSWADFISPILHPIYSSFSYTANIWVSAWNCEPSSQKPTQEWDYIKTENTILWSEFLTAKVTSVGHLKSKKQR